MCCATFSRALWSYYRINLVHYKYVLLPACWYEIHLNLVTEFSSMRLSEAKLSTFRLISSPHFSSLRLDQFEFAFFITNTTGLPMVQENFSVHVLIVLSQI